MPTSNKRQYTKAHAERIAALHAQLHGISEVVIHGDLVQGNESERIQLLLVAEEEEFYQSFVKQLKELRALYGNEQSEVASKFDVAQYLWSDRWPHWHAYEEFGVAIAHLDITVVPFNWQDRLVELSEHFMLTDLSTASA